MQENQNTEEVKEPVIGNFKPKRKFLNFVSAVNGARIRFIRDIAFLKGEKLSGILEGAIFKVTICEEGTIKFEEQEGTNLSDESMVKRLIDEIDEKDTTGYAQKFIVSGLEFADIDGKLCYLEVENQKPIDKLKSIFDEEEEQTNELSERGFSILDALFSSESDEVESDEIILSEKDAEIFVDALVNPAEPNEKLKEAAESYMEKQFRKMNEEKVMELEDRIEETQKEIIRYKSDVKMAQKKMDEKSESLKVLESRLESMKPGDDPNGYVFYVSEEIKDMEGLDETEAKVAAKIADIMKLKIDVLTEMLTGGYYKIKIAKKDDITNQEFELEKEVYQKITSLDVEGKLSVVDGEFQYRGKMTWHQVVGKMIRMGFEQEPEFDKLCQSNSYDSHEENKSTEMNLGNGIVAKSDEGFVDMGNGVFGIPPSDSVSETPVSAKSTSTEIKSKTLKTFNEETTLVVVGTTDHDDNRDVEITDDYTEFGLCVGDKIMKSSYESDGFISIMTLPEFKMWQSQYPDAMTDGGGIGSFLLPNFKGTIGVTAMTDPTRAKLIRTREDFCINGEFTSDFDLSDFIQHQDGMDEAEVFLTLPEGTKILKMDDYHKIPTAVLRDLKIDKIIK
jgi:hypothetical protein